MTNPNPSGLSIFYPDGSCETLADASEEVRRNFVENVFKPVGEDVVATMQDRERAWDIKTREIFQKIREIERTIPDKEPTPKPKIIIEQKWARQVTMATGMFFGAIQKTFKWIGKRTVS